MFISVLLGIHAIEMRHAGMPRAVSASTTALMRARVISSRFTGAQFSVSRAVMVIAMPPPLAAWAAMRSTSGPDWPPRSVEPKSKDTVYAPSDATSRMFSGCAAIGVAAGGGAAVTAGAGGGGGGGALLGGSNHPAPIASEDPTARSVLVRGDALSAPAGRADDFAWPRADERTAAPQAQAKPAATAATPAKP